MDPYTTAINNNSAILFFNFSWCMTDTNLTNSSLSQEWLITSENLNKRGLRYISTIEHTKYPFFGTIFHPEKIFEWNPNMNNAHSRNSVIANRYFYDLLVDLAKLNHNKFENLTKERLALIYNFSPVYSGADDTSPFEQIYVF